uniref:Tetratricopeptide repeat protein n=2 Tax=candidate division WOR-3 bacterium TaxID=2052148 RepID=A0A7V3ZYH4_UNCW3
MMKRLLLSLILLTGTIFAQEQQQAEPVDSAKVWFSIGRDYLNKNMFEDAIRNFKRSLRCNPNFIPAHLELAKAYIGIGTSYISKGISDTGYMFIDSAEAVYWKIREIDSTDSRGLQGLGFIYSVIKKDYNKAIEYYKSALSVDPENVDALYGLAKVYQNIGEKTAADSVYKAAVNKNPNSVGINYSYGLFLVELSRYDEAIPYLERALQLGIEDKDKEKEVLVAIVKSGVEGGKNKKELYQKVLPYADTLIKIDSTNYVYYIYRGDIYAGIGKRAQALKDYDAAINLSDNNPVAILKKAMYLTYDLKLYNDAVPVIQKLIGLPELTDYYKALGYFLLGDAYFGIANSTYQNAKAKGNRAGAGEAVRYYEMAKDAYTNALKYADANLKDQINKRYEMAEKNRSKAFGVWKGIEPW